LSKRRVKMSASNTSGTLTRRKWAVWIALCASLASAQDLKYDITPLFGGIFGGTLNLEQQGLPNVEAHLGDNITYGLAGGIRFDGEDCEDCSLIEFRWMRQGTHVGLQYNNPLVVTPTAFPSPRPYVTINDFLGDFTHEFRIEDVASIKPFVTATLGAALLGTPVSSETKFTFGIGAGMNIFPARHWGFRIQAEYLPIVMHANLQRLYCFGGCIVILSGGVMNQFQVTIGPSFRF